ncbi:hypothetical protein CASFOL_033239 [Castilleja foliolosa]|uniref:Uncharacterized protein n=1 Tax=Castilleja foliolosa TaxID=1961234 RepID=A0ABD3C0F5_9LAMI
MFNFRSFDTLVDPNNLDETHLFDLSGQQLSCTLWGDYVDEILVFEANIKAGPPVIILQLCRGKLFNDKVVLSTSFDTTQIHYLDTILAIVEFKSQIKSSDPEQTKSISRGILTSFRVEYDDLANGKITCNSVETIFDVDELQLDVLDQTSNASTLLWDREAEKLIGRPCQELRQEYVENVKTNKTELSYDLKKLIDQTVLFKVKIEKRNLHKENTVFPVTRMVTDPDIVAKYNQLTVDSLKQKEADFMTLMLNEDINSGMNSEDEVSIPVKKIISTKSDGECSCANKSLNFDEECVGSSTAKIHSNPSMTKSQYMRRCVVQDDEKQEFEDERGCENDDKSG